MPNIADDSVELGRDEYIQRIERLRSHIAAEELDGLLLLQSTNVTWASGFFHIPSERPVGFYLPRSGTPILFVPFLEKENAADNEIADVRWYWEYPGETPIVVWMLEEIGAHNLAVDGAGHSQFLQMQAHTPGLRLDASVAEMRWVKSGAELALIEKAAGYADYGLDVARQAVADGLAAGINEIDVVQIVQREATARMRHDLSDRLDVYRGAVALTAHTGARGALPHGRPGPYPIEPGHTLIVGIGVNVGGYHAESGCTFVVGEPSADQLRCLEATWACDQAAVHALAPGAACSQVNDAALDVLRGYGFGDAIRHRIGHGMGIEGHEAPWLSEGDETALRPGMVFSNEPGLYRPEIDGYRIIDTMVVTDNGGARLSHYLARHGPDDRVIGL